MIDKENAVVTAGRGRTIHPVPSAGIFQFRTPTAQDAQSVHALIAACPPLDRNSLYCNLLQCTHFADTCVLAERGGELKGWISGYRPPRNPDAMFVWQVAVHESARGQGLGLRMLDALFCLSAVDDATHLLTTVSPSNLASHALFARFARKHGVDVSVSPCFDSNLHFGGNHESEELLSIGPLQPNQFSI